MVTYKTVTGENLAHLDGLVNTRLNQGWRLYGNPYVVDTGKGSTKPIYTYHQAMTLTHKKTAKVK